MLSPVSTTRIDGWPVSITRQRGPCWQVMETGHPSTRLVETGLYSAVDKAHLSTSVILMMFVASSAKYSTRVEIFIFLFKYIQNIFHWVFL